MTTHCLIQGGQRTANPFYAMYPSVLPGVNDNFESAAHKGPVLYANTRVLDFDAGSLVTNLNVPQSISPETWGAAALKNYFTSVVAIAAGDVVQAQVIPRFATLTKLHWYVAKALPAGSYTCDIRVNGRATSMGGSPITLKSAIDMTVVASGIIDCEAANGGVPMYFDQNDILEVVFNTMPANTVASDGTFTGGLTGLALWVTPVTEEYLRGAF